MAGTAAAGLDEIHNPDRDSARTGTAWLGESACCRITLRTPPPAHDDLAITEYSRRGKWRHGGTWYPGINVQLNRGRLSDSGGYGMLKAFVVSLGALSFLCCHVTAEAGRTLIVSGTGVGEITRSASEDSLRRLYGDERVTPHLVDQGEGTLCRGSRITFADGDTLEVTWFDPMARTGVASIRIRGRRWHTKNGLRFGMTLKQVESLNGGAFVITGMDWDYAGTVLSWNGGALAGTLPQHVELRTIVRLGPAQGDRERVPSQEWAQVSGDRELSSDHPVLQKLNPRIYDLTVILRRHSGCEEISP